MKYRLYAIWKLLLGHEFCLIVMPEYSKSKQIFSFDIKKSKRLLDNFAELEKDIKAKMAEHTIDNIIKEVQNMGVK